MSISNIEIVEGFIDQIMNQKNLEQLSEYCSDDCIIHSTPYVGLGGNFDSTADEKLILVQIAPKGPMDGHLEIGDELIRVQKDDHNVETFKELIEGLWARGPVNTEVIVTVRRNGRIITVPLNLGLIEALDLKASDIYHSAVDYLRKYWPDVKTDIQEIFSAGDRVACYAVNHGTNIEFNRSAVWGEMDIFKLKDGRITEMWFVENTFDQLKQLGYRILEPEREPA
jgi:hypothetical protein